MTPYSLDKIGSNCLKIKHILRAVHHSLAYFIKNVNIMGKINAITYCIYYIIILSAQV